MFPSAIDSAVAVWPGHEQPDGVVPILGRDLFLPLSDVFAESDCILIKVICLLNKYGKRRYR